jgi:hypothetical protein
MLVLVKDDFVYKRVVMGIFVDIKSKELLLSERACGGESGETERPEEKSDDLSTDDDCEA